MSDYVPNGVQGAFYDQDPDFDVFDWIERTLLQLEKPHAEADPSR